MAKYRKLSDPPIAEAVLDFRVRRHEGVSIQDFEKLKEELSSLGFPSVKEQRSLTINFDLEKGEEKSAHGVTGLRFESENEDRLVHFQLAGFAYNLVGSYESWESMIEDAFRFWQIYKEAAKPKAIVRIGTRFINRLPQEPGTDVGRILIEPPRMPDPFELKWKGAAQRFSFEDPSGMNATYIQAVRPRGRSYDIIIDTDTYWELEAESEIELPEPRSEVYARLKPMRQLKNDLFFNSVTEEALKPYA